MRRLFLIVVFWGSMPAFFIDPFYGIVHYTLINIIRPEQLMWGDSSAVGRIFLASQAVVFLSWLMNKDKLTPEDTPFPFQMRLLWLFALNMTIVSFTVAYNQDVSWRWSSGFWKMSVLAFLMIKSINSSKKVQLYYTISLVWWGLLAIWGIQQKLGGNARMEGLGGVAMPDINGVAAMFVMYLPMAYYSIFSKNKWIRFLIGIPVTIIFIVFIIFSGSRGAFLGMLACMTLILLRANGKQRIYAIVVVGLLVLVFFFFAPPEYFERLTTIRGEQNEETGEIEHEASAAGRTAMWKGALYIYKNHPEYWLLGVGMKCYPLMYYSQHADELYDHLNEADFDQVRFHGSGGKDLHNTFLDVLMGGGMITFLTWMLLVFLAWFQAHRFPKLYPQVINGVNVHNYARALEVGIFGFCVCAMFVSLVIFDFFYWYALMPGILVNIARAKQKREELEQEEELVDGPLRFPGYSY
jgi:probable O-glycosylation ligase (exosortase A-associated)